MVSYLDYTYELRKAESSIEDKLLYGQIVDLFDNELVTVEQVVSVLFSVVDNFANNKPEFDYEEVYEEGYDAGYTKGYERGLVDAEFE